MPVIDRSKIRRPRNPAELRAALNALTAQQKAAIWTDLISGSPPKWATATGPIALALVVLHLLATEAGLPANVIAEAKLRAALLYLMDNRLWLTSPPFDPTINVPATAPLFA